MDASAAKRQTTFRQFLAVVLGVAIALGLIDMAFRALLPASAISRMQIDIQSPEALYIKLDEIRRFEGRKVVFLGDSLIFGRTMREHSNDDWENQTLPAQMERRFRAQYPDEPALFINLGMNGTIPSDLDKLIALILPLQPDLIVFDLTLRSFSRDFEGDAQTRPWLEEITLSRDGRFRGIDPVSDLMVNHWALYRYRDTFQALLFDGQPSLFLASKRDQLDEWLSGRQRPEADLLILLYKARLRYETVDLLPDNRQTQALERMVAALKAARQPALAFYATENAAVLDDLIERDRYDALQRRFIELTLDADGHLRWIGPLDIYDESDFLDHVHLNRFGYEKLTDALYPIADEMLLSNRRE